MVIHQKKFFQVRKCCCVYFFLFCLLFSTCAYATPLYDNAKEVFDEVDGEKDKLVLSFVGDCTIGQVPFMLTDPDSILTYIDTNGYDYPFKKVHHILADDDLTIANFEGVFHETNSGRVKKTYNFRAPSHYVQTLKEGSVEIVSLGNNHIEDFGPKGYNATIKTMDSASISWFVHCNHGNTSYLYEQGDVKIGFLSATLPMVWMKKNIIKADIEELRNQGADVVIFCFHGGREYAPRHITNQANHANRLIGYGADILIGTHPHCLQGYEVIDGAPIYYSLGNFVFGGNTKMRTKYTAILQFALSFDDEGEYMGYQTNILPCRLSTDETMNLYQPYPIDGEEAVEAIQLIQDDTTPSYPILDYQEGIGALQPFVPAVSNRP